MQKIELPKLKKIDPNKPKKKKILLLCDDIRVHSGIATMAKEFNANVILGFGGGSSMDSAKAIAVEATHEGTSWDYLFYRDTQPSEKTLPVITVSTTSGTGAHVTQVAVITNENDRDKSAIYNNNVIPKVSIVDPELMLSVPQNVTSATGFDVFCHAFESAHGASCGPNDSLS